MTQRWGIWFAVQGDLRFLSHHDMLRAMERTASRGRLGVKFSEGFNPRPAISLACPRPVGVASLADLLVARLEGESTPEDLLGRLRAHAPTGMTFSRAAVLGGKQAPQPIRAEYELPLPDRQRQVAARRLEALDPQAVWPIERMVSTKGRGRRKGRIRRTVDLRPLVDHVELGPQGLRWALVPAGAQWARPGELLRLVGLDDRVDLARVVRTAVTYQGDPATLAAPSPPNVSEIPQGGKENPT